MHQTNASRYSHCKNAMITELTGALVRFAWMQTMVGIQEMTNLGSALLSSGTRPRQVSRDDPRCSVMDASIPLMIPDYGTKSASRAVPQPAPSQPMPEPTVARTAPAEAPGWGPMP